MFAVFIPIILLSGTIFLGFDPHGVFHPADFAGTLVTSWLLLMAYTAVFVAIVTFLRSNGAAIATNICLVSISPTLLQALDFLFGRAGFKFSPSGLAKSFLLLQAFRCRQEYCWLELSQQLYM